MPGKQIKQRMKRPAGKGDEQQEAGLYEAYAGFARNVRVWFISYGIGAPVLFLTNNEAWKVMAASGQAKAVAYLFLVGVAVQILAALLYKTAMWYLYMSELSPDTKRLRMYRVALWLSESYFLESVFDLITLIVFLLGTLKVLRVFTG